MKNILLINLVLIICSCNNIELNEININYFKNKNIKLNQFITKVDLQLVDITDEVILNKTNQKMFAADDTFLMSNCKIVVHSMFTVEKNRIVEVNSDFYSNDSICITLVKNEMLSSYKFSKIQSSSTYVKSAGVCKGNRLNIYYYYFDNEKINQKWVSFSVSNM